jgi:8-oxo-dGTP diphosphatase
VAYTYEYPRPAVTADVVIFSIRSGELSVLLIKRGEEPHEGAWALPGGHVEQNESLEKAAARELAEETGVSNLPFEQLGAFGDPGRDPRGHYVTVAYYTYVGAESIRARAGDDASDVAWHPISKLELSPDPNAKARAAAATKGKKRAPRSSSDLIPLAFDHAKILRHAIERLRERLLTPQRPARFHLAPPNFTIAEIRRVYDVIFGQVFNPRSFKKAMLARDFIEPVAAPRKKGQKVTKSAQVLYRFKHAPRRRTLDD